jgi:hypothetical protein
MDNIDKVVEKRVAALHSVEYDKLRVARPFLVARIVKAIYAWWKQ